MQSTTKRNWLIHRNGIKNFLRENLQDGSWASEECACANRRRACRILIGWKMLAFRAKNSAVSSLRLCYYNRRHNFSHFFFHAMYIMQESLCCQTEFCLHYWEDPSLSKCKHYLFLLLFLYTRLFTPCSLRGVCRLGVIFITLFLCNVG